mgnify:CR=1 FL=1|tara:strand:+ start:268 stop:675 length:408 start_codon:yes stop_codon:yes gene_type:complete
MDFAEYFDINSDATNRVDQMKKVQNEGLELFKKKNTDYGDAFANYGVIGVLVRMGDKISRLQSITTKSISLVNTESLRDTLIDLHNYSAMAIMLLDEDKNQDQNQNRDNSIKSSILSQTSPDPKTLPPPPKQWLN